MAEVIKLRRGLKINLVGEAKKTLVPINSPRTYSIVPDDFYGISPKLMVKEGSPVKAGTPLFIHKNCPEINVVSPVSGVVKAIERGRRRKILNIVVEAAPTQEFETFETTTISHLNANAVKSALLQSGLFAFIRQRPYDIVADPNTQPKAIFVSAFDLNPLAPDYTYILGEEKEHFNKGLSALAQIAKTYLSIHRSQQGAFLEQIKDVDLNVFDGENPAGNVGVQINHIAPINKGETVWTIDPQAVVFIGRLFSTGKVDLTRTVAITGSEISEPAYTKIIVGAQLTELFVQKVKKSDKPLRYISGNVLTGKNITANGYLGAMHNQLTVIPEGTDNNELFGWIMPRLNQYSTSRSYFSWLMPKKQYSIDARIKGGERHMIMSGEYDKVLPMDILPEFLIKAIIAKDIERMEALGIYEVAPEDFALCEFVCSSKMPLQQIVRDGLDMLRIEMS